MSQGILLVCHRCGYQWLPRVGKPKRCPRCQTWDWDKPKEPDMPAPPP